MAVNVSNLVIGDSWFIVILEVHLFSIVQLLSLLRWQIYGKKNVENDPEVSHFYHQLGE